LPSEEKEGSKPKEGETKPPTKESPTKPPIVTASSMPSAYSNLQYHMGGFVTRFHKGGSLNYNPWGGLGGEEVPFIAQKGEYVLSKKDVEFVEKVKGRENAFTQINNIPPILPRVNVIVNNQSGSAVRSASAVRVADDSYIIDVLLKDLHSNGRFSRALNY